MALLWSLNSYNYIKCIILCSVNSIINDFCITTWELTLFCVSSHKAQYHLQKAMRESLTCCFKQCDWVYRSLPVGWSHDGCGEVVVRGTYRTYATGVEMSWDAKPDEPLKRTFRSLGPDGWGWDQLVDWWGWRRETDYTQIRKKVRQAEIWWWTRTKTTVPAAVVPTVSPVT